MADYGAEYTDKKIEELEKRITSIYREASHDVEMKMRDFNKRYKAKEAIYAKKLKNGEITQEDFNAWKRGQVFQGKQWQAKKQQLEDTLYNANSVAIKIANGETNGVFAANANYMSYSLEHGVGVNFGFGLYDESTVANLLKNEPDLLPKPRIKKPKDEAWNSKKITRQITQGIIQGESLDDIATRLADTTSSQNRDAMLTHARTAMTGAQNAGRQYQLGKAQDLGIKLKKEWMATLDQHTRINHILLDGQKVNTDDDFEVDGLKIRYPGDPQAVPAMTYNCRCTMVGDIEDYPATYDRYDNIDGKPIKNMTYTEWEAAKSKGEDISPVPLTYTEWEAAKKKSKSSADTIINGKDISAAWKRRPDQFGFEIEDVINTQGFDGKPRVVSAEEFDEAVKKSNFVAQRTYSAPDQETLDAYRDQLYNGKWYVDCSTGGAQYGQGMYCAADYTGTLTDGIKTEMEHYRNLGESRYGDAHHSYTETLTLDPSAKVITYRELMDIRTGNLSLDYRTNVINDIIKKSNYTDDEATFIRFNLNTGGVTWNEVNAAAGRLTNERIQELSEEFSKIGEEATKRYNEEHARRIERAKMLQHKFSDPGSLAAALGYDAINAEGHGQSGSYTVILNRTKCIFKGE